MYSYHESSIRTDRVARGMDHCASEGAVWNLTDLVVDSLVRDPFDRSQGLTTAGSTRSAVRVLIYAVDAEFRIRVGFDGTRGVPDAVKHETLFHNADVEAAGEMEIERGVITAVNDFSGSYRTVGAIARDRRFVGAVLEALNRIAAPISATERRRLEKGAGI